jgi:thiamine kinase-like enzyme
MLTSIIPESKIEAVERALMTAFGRTDVESIELLTGGLSTALVYKIVVDGKPWVLRIIMNINPISDPARHYACMTAAARAGVAPAVLYTSVEDALAISEFIPSEPLRSYVRDLSDRMLVQLAEMIRTTQSITPLFPPLTNFLDAIDGMIEEFKASGLLPESATEEHFNRYTEIQRVYPRHDPDLVSSHNDMNLLNILYDGERFWAIDWEAAFRNDRYVDPAVVANSMMLHGEREETFLRAYFGTEPDDYQRARFFLMRQVCHVFYAMLFMKLAITMRTPDSQHDDTMESINLSDVRAAIGDGSVRLDTYEGQLIFGKARLNAALDDMRSERFAWALEQVEAGRRFERP